MRPKRGFTLVELLIVIAIIALLLSILVPSLGHAKVLVYRIQCQSHMRTIALGWNQYHHDNKGDLVGSNSPGGGGHWVKGGNTVRSMTEGMLWDYVGQLGHYCCPTPINEHYYRSYSMSGNMNGEGSRWTKFGLVPDPGGTLLLTEEDDWRGYNVNSWYIQRGNFYGWVDYMAGNHEKGDNIAFCDMHVEYWVWQDPDTLTLPYSEGGFGRSDQGSVDLERLAPIFKSASFYDLNGRPL